MLGACTNLFIMFPPLLIPPERNCSANELLDVADAQPVLLVMRAALIDASEDVVVAGVLPSGST